MSMPITEKLIQRQINHWNRFRKFLPEPDHASVTGPGPIITISRLAGSGGRILANTLADRLGLQVHDRSLVEKIARDSNLENRMIAELDEAGVNQARLWVQGVLTKRIFMRDQYHLALVKAVTALAAKGSVVFLGRGADLILGLNATLRIRLVASRQTRMDNIRKQTGMSQAEAGALLEETDRKRVEYVRKMFREDPARAGLYDLVINTDRVGLETQLQLVSLALLEQQAGGMKPAGENGSAKFQTAKG